MDMQIENSLRVCLMVVSLAWASLDYFHHHHEVSFHLPLVFSSDSDPTTNLSSQKTLKSEIQMAMTL
jgi:hypothetical protein